MRGRRIPRLVILGVGAVVVLAALQWREVIVRWRVADLAQPGVHAELPVEVVLAAPGTIASDTLTQYLRTSAGKERLLRSYLRVFEKSGGDISKCLAQVGDEGETALVFVWMGNRLAAWASTDRQWVQQHQDVRNNPLMSRRDHFKPRRRMSSSLPDGEEPLHKAFYTRLQDLIVEVGYDEYPLPGRPGARFSTVSGAGAETPRKRHLPWDFEWGTHAGLIESDPYRLDLGPGYVSPWPRSLTSRP